MVATLLKRKRYFTVVLVLGAIAGEARAQSSSMLGDPARRRPLTLATNSWTYQAVQPPPEIQLNDLVTIIIDTKAQVIAEGEVDRRKKANLEAALKKWTLLKGGDLIPDPQSAGSPEISGMWNNKYKAEAGLETQEAMKSRIACRVVDIRPNGNLILEGHNSIQINHEVWGLSLTGEIRPEDVLPNNTVLSENVVDLRIHKREEGHTRDGYRRGWLMKFLDEYQPF